MLDRVRLQGVLVIYRCKLKQSPAWLSLERQVDASLLQNLDFELLVCENGAEGSAPTDLPSWVTYQASERNLGLAWAYNQGLERARARSAGWLLTLDQDTTLPDTFLVSMGAHLRHVSAAKNIGAVVPQLVGPDGRVHSPARVKLSGERPLPVGFTGVISRRAFAYNSAAILRVSALEAVGGYDRRFWLDYLDHALFRALYSSGQRVWVAGDVQVQHHLSLHEGREQLSETRFRNFARAESAFRDLHETLSARLLFTARLLLRVLAQRRRGDAEHFTRTTLSVLRERLFTRRRRRISLWEQSLAAHEGKTSQ